MLAEYLTFRGFEVETADGGLEAFERTIARPPALVLMDLMMPGVDGWEATRRLKADPRTKDVIVIALTARTFTQDVVHVPRLAPTDLSVSRSTSRALWMRLRRLSKTDVRACLPWRRLLADSIFQHSEEGPRCLGSARHARRRFVTMVRRRGLGISTGVTSVASSLL